LDLGVISKYVEILQRVGGRYSLRRNIYKLALIRWSFIMDRSIIVN